MRPAVADKFVAFQARFEGCTSWPYLDVKGLVTVAIGLLIDPVETALALPWVIGEYVTTEAEVRQQWAAVKAQAPARLASYYRPFTTIRLTSDGIQQVTLAKAAQMESILRQRMDWDDFPANVQLAIFGVAWACGPEFHFPRFMAALQNGDWQTAADECAISTVGNPGVVARNQADRALLLAAAADSDPDVVSWP